MNQLRQRSMSSEQYSEFERMRSSNKESIGRDSILRKISLQSNQVVSKVSRFQDSTEAAYKKQPHTPSQIHDTVINSQNPAVLPNAQQANLAANKLGSMKEAVVFKFPPSPETSKMEDEIQQDPNNQDSQGQQMNSGTGHQNNQTSGVRSKKRSSRFVVQSGRKSDFLVNLPDHRSSLSIQNRPYVILSNQNKHNYIEYDSASSTSSFSSDRRESELNL